MGVEIDFESVKSWNVCFQKKDKNGRGPWAQVGVAFLNRNPQGKSSIKIHLDSIPIGFDGDLRAFPSSGPHQKGDPVTWPTAT